MNFRQKDGFSRSKEGKGGNANTPDRRKKGEKKKIIKIQCLIGTKKRKEGRRLILRKKSELLSRVFSTLKVKSPFFPPEGKGRGALFLQIFRLNQERGKNSYKLSGKKRTFSRRDVSLARREKATLGENSPVPQIQGGGEGTFTRRRTETRRRPILGGCLGEGGKEASHFG